MSKIIHVSSFDKGWEDEKHPLLHPNNAARDMMNMRIISNEGNSFSVETINGNVLSFVLNNGYKYCGHIEFNELLMIFSTNDDPENPVGSNGEIGIVEIDDKTKTGQYIPLYNHKDLNFSLSNKIYGRASEENSTLREGYFWDNRNPPRLFNIDDPIFRTYIDPPDLVNGEQYMVIRGSVTQGSVTYGINEQLGTVFTADGTEVYSSDALVIRYYRYELLELIPKKICGHIEFVKYISGSLFNGNYIYFYQLESKSGVRTSWSIGTNPIHLTSSIPSGLNGVLSQAEGYEGMGGATGSTPVESDLNTNKGIRIKISNIDRKYDRIRVAYVRSVDYNQFSEPVVFYYEDITAEEMIIDHYSATGSEKLLIEDLFSNIEGIERNKCGCIIRNLLILGNYRTRIEFKWKPQAVLTPVCRSFLSDTVDSFRGGSLYDHPTHNDPITIHLVGTGPATVISSSDSEEMRKVYPRVWYEVLSGGVEHNSVVYTQGQYFTPVNTDIEIAPGYSDYEIIPVIRIEQYTGKYKYIRLDRDWYDGRGMTVDTYCKSRWRGETYRIGCVLFDLWGNPYHVAWLGDIRMPEQYEPVVRIDNDDINDPQCFLCDAVQVSLVYSNPPGPPVTIHRNVYYLKHIGIRVSELNFQNLVESMSEVLGKPVTIDDLPKYFNGFSIVCAKRDEEIVAQGMVHPSIMGMKIPSGNIIVSPMSFLIPGISSTYYEGLWHYPGSINPYTAPNIFLEYYSPDILLMFGNKDYSIQPGDKLKLVAWLEDKAQVPFIGTKHTTSYHYYHKYMYFINPPSGYAGFGTEKPISHTSSMMNINIGEIRGFPGATHVYENIACFIDYDEFLDSPVHGYAALGYNKSIIVLRNITGLPKGFGADIYTSNRILANIVRPKAVKYGGTSEQALASTVYYTTGHYQPFDDDFIQHLKLTVNKNYGEANRIEAWGGDCNVSLFGHVRNHQIGVDTVNTHDRWSYLNNRGSTVAALEPSADRYYRGFSHSVIFPVESNVNPHLREGYRFTRNRNYGDNGSGYPVNGSGLIFPLVATEPMQVEQYIYNDSYSSGPYIVPLPGQRTESRVMNNNEFRSRFKFSIRKNLNEQINAFRIFKNDAWRDMEGWAGEINEIIVKNDQVFVIQNKGVAVVPIDEKAAIPGNLKDYIVLASADMVGRHTKFDDYVGTQHQGSVIDLPDGFMFFDARTKSMYMYKHGSGIVRVDLLADIRNQISSIAESDILIDKPLLHKGITGVWHQRKEEALITFMLGSFVKTIGFNPYIMRFTAAMSDIPSSYIRYGANVFTTRSRKNENLGTISNNHVYNMFDRVRDGDGVYICIEPYTSGSPAVSPSNDPQHWKLITKYNHIEVIDHGDIGLFHGTVDPSWLTVIVNSEPGKQKSFETMEQIGVTKHIWTKVRCESSDSYAEDNDLDYIPSGDYELIDGKWFSNLPLSSDDRRLEDTSIKLTLMKDNRKIQNGTRIPWISSNERIRLTNLIVTSSQLY